jgi:transposase-like protein
LSRGAKVTDVVKAIEIHKMTYYRWRKEYGGLKVTQAKRLRELEKENGRLRKAISDLTLDKTILQEAARGDF